MHLGLHPRVGLLRLDELLKLLLLCGRRQRVVSSSTSRRSLTCEAASSLGFVMSAMEGARREAAEEEASPGMTVETEAA